jgi:hypothetical protein
MIFIDLFKLIDPPAQAFVYLGNYMSINKLSINNVDFDYLFPVHL